MNQPEFERKLQFYRDTIELAKSAGDYLNEDHYQEKMDALCEQMRKARFQVIQGGIPNIQPGRIVLKYRGRAERIQADQDQE